MGIGHEKQSHVKFMMTHRGKLLIYFTCDAALNISARSFQIFCTWIFITKYHSAQSLSLILLVSWLANTLFLPFAGIFTDRIRKATVLIISASFIFISAVAAISINDIYANAKQPNDLIVWFVWNSFVFGLGTALLFPLGVPLIPEICETESEVKRGVKIKASMFIVNLIFGPTLAGLAISTTGGRAVLLLCIAAAIVGLAAALAFSSIFKNPPVNTVEQFTLISLFLELVDGGVKILKIKAEFAIAAASLFANILFVPFLFVLLPQKMLLNGHSMLELAEAELCIGMGIIVASNWLVQFCQKHFSDHTIATYSILSIGLSIGSCSFTEQLVPICALAAVLGAGLTTFNVIVNTKRALAIPEGFRSKMESVMLFACTSAVPIGLWFVKVALEHASANLLILYGTLLFSSAVLIVSLSKSLQEMLNQVSESRAFYKVTNPGLFNS